MTRLYSPKGNRPNVPRKDNENCYDYLEVAWHVYWQMVRKSAKRRKCSLLDAHRYLQKKHPFQQPDTKEGYWRADDFLLLFMFQFEAWQMKDYDMDEIGFESQTVKADCVLFDAITDEQTLSVAFQLVPDTRRDDFITNLWCRGLWGMVEQMKDDPIYGHDARHELFMHKWLEEHRASEKVRRAALPPNVKKIDRLLATLSPSNYNVEFPYAKNQFHSFDNCLCVTADGTPVFRLVVLDPAECTRFLLVEVMPPWWREHGPINFKRPEPGEGEYDFPFYDFDLTEGDEIDLSKLMEVLRRGKEQLATRGRRKFGTA